MIIFGNPLPIGTEPASESFGFAELELDVTTHDVKIPIRILRGPLAVAQRVRCRFKMFLGEWFLDTRLGVPYHRDILIKNPDTVLISAIFRQVLRDTPGVKSVVSLVATIDKATRTMTVNFQAILFDGSTLTFKDEPFIIG